MSGPFGSPMVSPIVLLKLFVLCEVAAVLVFAGSTCILSGVGACICVDWNCGDWKASGDCCAGVEGNKMDGISM